VAYVGFSTFETIPYMSSHKVQVAAKIANEIKRTLCARRGFMHPIDKTKQKKTWSTTEVYRIGIFRGR
jgi:hypothetical protein